MTTILLIDLSSVAHPIFHTSQGSTNPNETSIQTVAKVRALASGQPHVAICLDSGRSFRRELDDTYKANRPPADATLQHQIALAVETLKADGFPCWAVKGFEADDLIASAVEHAAPLFKGFVTKEGIGSEPVQCLIASSDKDLLQLVGPRVTIKKLTDGSDWDEGRVYVNLGVNPNQIVDFLSLCGDASDNIKGAKGIGPKIAAALLTKYGTLEDLYAALDRGENGFKPATLQSLQEFRPRMEGVKALVTLRTDVPLPFDEVFKDRKPADVAVFDGEEPQMPVAAMPEPASEPIAQVPLPEPSQAPIATPEPQKPSVEVLPAPVPSDTRWQLEPRNMPEAITLAKHMHDSRLFSAYGTPQGVLATILAGRELGIQAMASLRAFHIIEGKPTMSADLIRALVLKSGHAEYFRCTERTAMRATFVTKRKGDPELSLSFTIEEGRVAFAGDDAKWAKSGWGKNPADMLVARASVKLARLVYADVVFNMYAPEELDGAN